MANYKNSGFDREIRRCAVEIKLNGLMALGALFDLTARRALRLAVSITNKAEDAEDVVQTVMLRIAKDPSRLATAVYPSLYLIQMVRNESLTVLRKRKRTQCSGNLTETSLPALRPQAGVQHRESQSTVQLALDALPAKQAEVVVLKVWEQLTFAEIGKILGVSANTAASRYRYALEKLSRSLMCFADDMCCPESL